MDAGLEEISGGEFIFGMRPEHFQDATTDNGQTAELPIIKATINDIETPGKETFLDLSTGEHSLAALLDADMEAKTHQEIGLVPNLDKIYLFSSQSGEAIF